MEFAFQYLRPAWGPRARAVPGESEANRNKSGAPDVVFPPAHKDVRDYGAGLVPGRFPRMESRSATLAASALFQEIARFSGRPDRIDLGASAVGVEFRFRNRGQDATTGLVIRGVGQYETDASFELVEARDPAAGGGQFVTAVGYWAAESVQD